MLFLSIVTKADAFFIFLAVSYETSSIKDRRRTEALSV